jgi:hypothetical protein
LRFSVNIPKMSQIELFQTKTLQQAAPQPQYRAVVLLLRLNSQTIVIDERQPAQTPLSNRRPQVPHRCPILLVIIRVEGLATLINFTVIQPSTALATTRPEMTGVQHA